MLAAEITDFTVTSSLGLGRDAHIHALRTEQSGLRSQAFGDCPLNTWTGQVSGLEQALTGKFAQWDCRNNRLAWLGLAQDGFRDTVARLRERHGPSRIGVFIGTSTSGVGHAEQAYRQRDPNQLHLPEWFDYQRTQSTFSCADFVREAFELQGVSMAISTACTSSAKVFASAFRAIQCGWCDAAIVGGVDSLCMTTLHGFNSLQLVSAEPCRPADPDRNGISIGEAAGFAVIDPSQESDVALLGYGESSDAWHMSAPDPEGRGAMSAMHAALKRAGLDAAEIDYINLHGTATPANDLAEASAVAQVFGDATPCSSTKGWTGHTLGAAGILEAAISMLCIRNHFLPRSLNTRRCDPLLPINVLLSSREVQARRIMSNSFGFGGSNCSLIFGARGG